MGVRNRAFIAQSLIDAGRQPDEAVAFVQHGTFHDERVMESTLRAVAGCRVAIDPPAVFVVGEVVRLRKRLNAIPEALEPLSPAEQS